MHSLEFFHLFFRWKCVIYSFRFERLAERQGRLLYVRTMEDILRKMGEPVESVF